MVNAAILVYATVFNLEMLAVVATKTQCKLPFYSVTRLEFRSHEKRFREAIRCALRGVRPQTSD